MDQSRLVRIVKELFSSQRLAVLSTQGEGTPYGNLVAFVVSADLKNLFFITGRKTRKFTNIITNPQVSLVMDNRSNRPSDFQEAVVITALGRAEEINEGEKGRILEFFLARHSDLRPFATSPDCALIEVRVEKYIVVSHFQEVAELLV
ncbi:MAG: pyridoxamine 5'-phosphate oxidase family protein [Syntrophales bacterium LBB04]|nr:pyridoxamine 5'-phosphate oxidase family protein [Syntrophales bacterium LBB04]